MSDPTVRELENTARQGLRAEGRGCIFYVHSLDGTSQMWYCSLAHLQADPLPGIGDDPDLIKRLETYDTIREYAVIEFIEETDGMTEPIWYSLLYKDSKPTPSA